MNTADCAKRIVNSVKKRLKTESDPEQRYGLAVVGDEFNKLYMELSGMVFIPKPKRFDIIGRKKVCDQCFRLQDLKHFGYSQHKMASGKIKRYPRTTCNHCLYLNRQRHE